MERLVPKTLVWTAQSQKRVEGNTLHLQPRCDGLESSMNKKQRLKLTLEELGTHNVAMARCLKLAGLAASSDVPVLILGETGTGKTLLAEEL